MGNLVPRVLSQRTLGTRLANGKVPRNHDVMHHVIQNALPDHIWAYMHNVSHYNDQVGHFVDHVLETKLCD